LLSPAIAPAIFRFFQLTHHPPETRLAGAGAVW
jgi:hypothetical protein